jgi:hypothetical protein
MPRLGKVPGLEKAMYMPVVVKKIPKSIKRFQEKNDI